MPHALLTPRIAVIVSLPMKIAFIKPPIGGILGLEMLTFVEPLGPICVAACLEADGHECAVYDLRIDGEEAGLAACTAFDPDVVGLQCNFTTERNRTIRLAQKIKREMPRVFIVIGGHDASRDPEFFKQSGIDAVAVGDGEEVMRPPGTAPCAGRGEERRQPPARHPAGGGGR